MSNVVARANRIVFLVLIALLVVAGGLSWNSYTSANQARPWVRHTYEVMGAIKDVELALRDAENGQRGFLLTGQDSELALYQAAVDEIAAAQRTLQRLTADSAVQQERLRSLAVSIRHLVEGLSRSVQLRRESGLAPAVAEGAAGQVVAHEIAATLAAMTDDEASLLGQRIAAVDERLNRLLWLTAVSTVLAAALLLWAARMLNRAWANSSRAAAEQETLATRLQTSLDSLSQGIGVFDAERRLTHWNECFEQLLELPPAMVRAAAPYDSFHTYLVDDGTALLESEAQIRFGQSRPGQAVVYERTRADGRALELRRTPMPDDGFVLTISDMTKRAAAEGILRESQKMQAIGQLTGGIAHDFNNLLTVVLGNLEFLRNSGGPDPRTPVRVERAIWAAQRGATLTRQLLAFARKQPLTPAPIALSATVPDMVPLLRRTLGEHIDVRYVDAAGLWPAMADPAQLESALLNLALNARDAMPGGGRLTIELANKVLDADYAGRHAEVVAGDYTMLAVSDTGQGMAPEVLSRAFEPFFTTKADGKGSGLGLAMVFGFVKQSGGHVKIYSEPGEGTTVRLYLPRAVGVAAGPASGSRSVGPIELPRGSATILVVEDEPAVREIAVAILGDLGYRVLEASEGEEGLRVFGAHAAAVDLLLTDVVLPGKVRGRELAERITAIRPQVQVLYMSGYTENSIVHNGRLDDGVQLISKPFDREQLARKVADILAARPASIAVGTDSGKVVELKQRRGD